jgi:lipoprotein-releasing system permease protein
MPEPSAPNAPKNAPKTARAGLPFSIFLGMRYLRPKRTMVGFITLINIAGVMLGITILILVISVMTGFEREIKEKILSFEAHLLVTNGQLIHDYQPLMERINETEGIVATAPYMQGPVLMQSNNRVQAVKVRGIEMRFEREVTDIAKREDFIVAGEANLNGEYALVGSNLASQLGLSVGSKITLYSPSDLQEVMYELDLLQYESTHDEEGNELDESKQVDAKTLDQIRQMVLPTELTVSGIFETGRGEYDAEFLLVPLWIGQELYSLEGAVHGITARTADPYKVDQVQQRMLPYLEWPMRVNSWIDMNSQFFSAIAAERRMMFFLLFCVVIVAGFCIMVTMITVTVQKTREVGIMKALGATRAQIVWVFLSQGMIVGLLGNFAGLTLGLLLVTYRNSLTTILGNLFGFDPFPQSVYQLSEIPAQIVPEDVAFICVGAFIICSLAALFPAYMAARLDPVRALRQE